MHGSSAMDRRDHAAPPDDGHQGSYTVPSDVIVPGHETAGSGPGIGQLEPRLHTDPQTPTAESPRRIQVGALLGGIAIVVLLAALTVFAFMTSMR